MSQPMVVEGGENPGDEPGPGQADADATPQASQGSVTAVKVAVRVRPLIGMETAAGCQACMFGDSEQNQVCMSEDPCQR